MTGYWGYRPCLGLHSCTPTKLDWYVALVGRTTLAFPSYSTFRRVLQTLNFQPLTDLFNNWAATTIPLMPEERLAVDGKSIRCTVCDYAHTTGAFLLQPSRLSSPRHRWLTTAVRQKRTNPKSPPLDYFFLSLSGLPLPSMSYSFTPPHLPRTAPSFSRWYYLQHRIILLVKHQYLNISIYSCLC